MTVTAAHPRWATDAPLRTGMAGVQNALLGEYFGACSQGPTRVGYDQLAAKLDREVEDMGRLSRPLGGAGPETAGLMRRLTDGAILLRGLHDPQAGVPQVVSVLVAYSTDYEDAGWRPRRPGLLHRLPAEAGPAGTVAPSPIGEASSARAERQRICAHLADRTFTQWPWYMH